MTEKRYYSNHLGVIFDNARYGINSMTTKEIVDLLNTQEETIRGLFKCKNELSEELEKEKDKYSMLFEKYWDLKKKMNQISDVIYRYDNRIMGNPVLLGNIENGEDSEKVKQIVIKAFETLGDIKDVPL